MFGRERGFGMNPLGLNNESESNSIKDPQKPTGEKGTRKEKFGRFFSRKKNKPESGGFNAPEPDPKEAKESAENKSSPGEVLIGELVTDPETPKYVIDDLKKPKIILKVQGLINNREVFGQKLKKTWETVRPGLAGAAAGAVMRSATKFALKRTLDFGSVGASAVAGGLVGGGMEFYKANKAEKQRLNNLDTYNKTLDGYEKMSDLEKATAYVALESALKERNLDPTTHAELSARMLELKVSADKKDAWEKNDKSERLLKLLEIRQNAELASLAKWRSKEEAKILSQLYKEQGLGKNWKKISFNTFKGAVIGAGAGALGAWVFEHFSGPAVQTAVDHRPGGLNQAAVPRFIPPAETAQANLPSKEDVQTLHKTVWNTAKQYLQDHGVKKPSVKDINQAMVIISGENNIEITGHHPGAPGSTWYKGFNHLHKEDAGALKDTQLQEGMKLKGFDKLADLVKKAGGHIALHQEAPVAAHNELVGKVPVSGMGKTLEQTVSDKFGPSAWLDAIKQNTSTIKRVVKIIGYVGGGSGLSFGGYKIYKKIKNRPSKENLKSEEAASPQSGQESSPKDTSADSEHKAEKTSFVFEPKKNSISPEILAAGAVLATPEVGRNQEKPSFEELKEKITELSNKANKVLDNVEAYLSSPNPDYFKYDDMLEDSFVYLNLENWTDLTENIDYQLLPRLSDFWRDSAKILMERRANITDKAEKIFNFSPETKAESISTDSVGNNVGGINQPEKLSGASNQIIDKQPPVVIESAESEEDIASATLERRFDLAEKTVKNAYNGLEGLTEYLNNPVANYAEFVAKTKAVKNDLPAEKFYYLTTGASEKEYEDLRAYWIEARRLLVKKYDGIRERALKQFFPEQNKTSEITDTDGGDDEITKTTLPEQTKPSVSVELKSPSETGILKPDEQGNGISGGEISAKIIEKGGSVKELEPYQQKLLEQMKEAGFEDTSEDVGHKYIYIMQKDGLVGKLYGDKEPQKKKELFKALKSFNAGDPKLFIEFCKAVIKFRKAGDVDDKARASLLFAEMKHLSKDIAEEIKKLDNGK